MAKKGMFNRLKKSVKPKTDELFIDGVDASVVKPEFDECKDFAKITAMNNEVFRKAIYYLYKAMKKHKIYLNNRQVSKHISRASGCNRSMISRYFMCAKMEFSAGIPAGLIKEFVCRELRRMVDDSFFEDTIKDAFKLAGSYENITVNHIFEVAKRNGFLKEGLRDSKEMADKNKVHQKDKSTNDTDHRPSRNAPKRPEATRKLDERKLQDYPEFKGILSEISASKSETTWVRKYLEQSYVNADLIEELESLTLHQRQSLLRILP
jgi:hypothetical protein